MKRLYIFFGGLFFVFILLPASLVWYAIASFDIETPTPTPFSKIYPVKGAENVIVTGTDSGADLHGDWSTSYDIFLKFPKRPKEKVNSGYRFNEDAPTGPFRVIRTNSDVFFTSGHEIFRRPINSRDWQPWSFREQKEVLLFGRAIMPDRYIKNEQFHRGMDFLTTPTELHRLPGPPLYTFERLADFGRTLIMHQSGALDFSHDYATHTPSSIWPRRLAFRDWKFDVQKSLALDHRLKLRPVPANVTVWLLEMRFPEGLDWKRAITRSKGNKVAYLNYDLVQNIPGAQILRHQRRTLKDIFTRIPVAPRADGKTSPVLLIKGFCGDPNKELFHYKWTMPGRAEHWSIAHNGERRPLLQDGDKIIFVRFKWS